MIQNMQRCPEAFRRRLRIDADGRVASLCDVQDDWQRRDFEALDAGWRLVAGHSAESIGGGAKSFSPPYFNRAWLERPRGHSKTTDIAVQVTWTLFASHRPIKGVAAAADQDQARLLRDAIQMLCRCNPWLGKLLHVQKNRIINTHTRSELEIITSDSATSYGLLCDFIVCDEIVHWSNRDLWDSLVSSAAKRTHCMLLVITNAGFQTEWQWTIRQVVEHDTNWYFSRLDGPQASWITEDRLAEQRKLLPDIAYRRLWLNEWSSGSGDAISSDDISHALSSGIEPLFDAESGWLYVAGLDLGLSRDATALCIVGKHIGSFSEVEKKPKLSSRQRMLIETGVIDEPESEWIPTGQEGTGKLRLAHVGVWKPEGGRRVDISSVEKTIRRIDERFHLASLSYDPWQSQYLGQRLNKLGIPAEPVPMTSANQTSMAGILIEAFRERNIELFDDENLTRDIRQLRVKETSERIRLDSPRGPHGHGDSATALSLALYAANGITHVSSEAIQGELVCWP